jgi:hypothetical protein
VNDLQEMLSRPTGKAQLYKRVMTHYSWDAVSDAYEQLAKGEMPEYRVMRKAETIDSSIRKEFPVNNGLIVVE